MPLLSFLLILLSLLQGTPASSQTTANAIKKIEQRFTSLLLNKDEVAFGDLLAEDLVHIGFEGQAAGKAEYMRFFKQGGWRYLKYEPRDVAIKILGNVAVVTGRVNRTIRIDDKEITGAFSFTHVWSQVEGRWRLISSQRTTIPNPTS